jgi:hypothetical protein
MESYARIPSTQEVYNAAMDRSEERPLITETVLLPKPEISREEIDAISQ